MPQPCLVRSPITISSSSPHVTRFARNTASVSNERLAGRLSTEEAEPSAISYSEEAVDFSEDKIQPNATGWPTATRRVYSEEDEMVVGEYGELKSPTPQPLKASRQATATQAPLEEAEPGVKGGRREMVEVMGDTNDSDVRQGEGDWNAGQCQRQQKSKNRPNVEAA